MALPISLGMSVEDEAATASKFSECTLLFSGILQDVKMFFSREFYLSFFLENDLLIFLTCSEIV